MKVLSKNSVMEFVKKTAILWVMIILILILSVISPSFFRGQNPNRTKRNHFCRDCREFCGIYFVDCGIQSKEAARNCLFGYFCTVYICCMRAKISAAMGVVDVGFCRGIVWNVLCNGRMQS